MQTEKGRIADWNDEKGFGFITPESGGKKIFFHINAYSSRHKRPLRNLEVQYFLSLDQRGRACAVDVVPTNGHKDNGREIRQKFIAVALFAGFAAMLSFLFQTHRLPLEIVYIYIVMSALAFFLYAKDKNAAESGTWRTSENTLHFVSMLGGWPGAKNRPKLFAAQVQETVVSDTLLGNGLHQLWRPALADYPPGEFVAENPFATTESRVIHPPAYRRWQKNPGALHPLTVKI